MFFTHHQPNGRFEVGKKICLSISGYHPETWQPSWSIRTALLAIIGFMPTPSKGTIGSLDYSAEERKKLAKKSLSYVSPHCGLVAKLLKSQNTSTEDSIASTAEEAKEIIKTMSMKVYIKKNFFPKLKLHFFYPYYNLNFFRRKELMTRKLILRTKYQSRRKPRKRGIKEPENYTVNECKLLSRKGSTKMFG